MTPPEQTTQPNAPGRGVLPLLAACVGLALVAGLGWYGWRWYAAPPPPELPEALRADPPLYRAVSEARERVAADPWSAEAWGRLGQVLLAHAYSAEAEPCLAQAERLDPAEPRWPYLQGWSKLLRDPGAAVPCFRRALARCEPGSGHQQAARLRLAQTLLDRGEFDEAGRLFTELLAVQPGNPLVHLGLGSVAVQRGDLPAAVEQLRAAADSPFTRYKANAQLAAVYRRQGKTELAADADRRAQAFAKDAEWPDPFVQEFQGMVVGLQTRLLRAENAQRAGQLRESAGLLRELLHDYPDDTRAQVKLGMVLVELGDYPAAEETLRQTLRLDPGKVQAHVLLAAALFHQAERRAKGADGKDAARKQFDEAADQARAALRLQPNHAYAYLYLGLALRQLDRPDEAIAALESAVRCGPETADPHLHLGEALLAAGRRDEAIRHLEDAARVAPPSDRRPADALARARGKS
jgi:tetratricopeptide (TPR) repeat protein